MAKKKRNQINRNLRRAVIYIRYSSHNQSDGYSIEYQLEQVHAYAEKHGYTIVGEYIDKAKTAKKTAGRDSLEEMLNDAEKDIYDVIIVFSFNRAFRNTLDALSTHTKLKDEYGILLLSCIEHIDMTNPHGVYAATSLFAMHQLSSEITAEHVKAAMYYAVQQGYYMGGKIPFGYKLVGTGEYTKGRERKRFAICPETAPYVQQIFEMYNAGVSTFVIADMLYEKGIRNKKGTEMSPSTIRRLVAFEGYTGISTHHFKGYEPLTTDKLYPPIISKETFEITKEERKKRANKCAPRYTGHEYYYNFSGKSFCAKCGRLMTVVCSDQRRNRYYYCSSTRTTGVKSCGIGGRCDTTDKLVMDAIYENILNKDAIKSVAAQIADIAQKTKQPEIDVPALKKEKADIKEALKELLNKSIYKKISEDVFEELSAEHTERLEQIEKQITLSKHIEQPITEEDVLAFLKSIKKQDKKNIHSAKAIFDTFVEKITFDNGKIIADLIVPPILYRGTIGRAKAPLYKNSIIIDL